MAKVAAPPSPSGMAALQYLMDMRHTALGLVFKKASPLAKSDLTSKIALVTGGTGGIGLADAQALASAGATVHVTGRDSSRGKAAEKAVPPETSGKIVYHQLDLSSISAARRLKQLMDESLDGHRLDILVQNLATMPNSHEILDNGHERTLSTNLLAFFEIGETLAPLMSEGGRVINVVSAGMHMQKLSVRRLKMLDDRSGSAFEPIFAYCITHRARVVLTQRWAKQHPFLFFASVHPGWVATDGIRNADAMKGFYAVMKHTLRTPAQGADTIAWLAAPATRVGAGSSVPSGSYMWDRAVRSVDLLLSGTQTSKEEAEALVEYLQEQSRIES